MISFSLFVLQIIGGLTVFAWVVNQFLMRFTTRSSYIMRIAVGKDVRVKIENLRVLAEKVSYAHIIQCALAIYEYLWRAKNRGAVIVIRETDGAENELDVR